MVVTGSAVVIDALGGGAWPLTGAPGLAATLAVMAVGVLQMGMGFGLLSTALRLRRELTG